MKRQTRMFHQIVGALLLGSALSGCGGGDSGPGEPPVAATSASFSPTTAKNSAGQNVPLRWTYVVNNGQPVTASLQGVSIGITVGSAEVTLDPAELKRRVRFQGPVTASAGGVSYSGNFVADVSEDIVPGTAGNARFTALSTDVELTLSGGGTSESGQVSARIDGFAPAYGWFPDREDLDQLAVGHVEVVATTGVSDVEVNISGETPIVSNNQPISISERWVVLEKLTSFTVRGTTYRNVVRLSRETRVPDFSGSFVPVTMFYWVAKGVGMIRGQGVYQILNLDDVVIELDQTNLTPV